MIIEKLINSFPGNFTKKKKISYFTKAIKELTNFHKKKCKEYSKILNLFNSHKYNKLNLSDYPFLPARIFKKFDLKSIPENRIVKKLVSSGTTSQNLSKIYLDTKNANNQIKVLNKIMTPVLGNQRLPMLIIDQNPTLKDRSTFNARIAAIYGFSIFGKNHTYLLNNEDKIDYNLLNKFLKKFGNQKFFIFGFTSMVFKNLVQNFSNKFIKLNFKNGILLHGGGWKKLEELKISNNVFKKKLFKKLKLKNVYNYYGLIEQTGSIFIECNKCERFVTSAFSDILVRDEKFKLVKNGKEGLIQLLSLLPTSYPGHNILTEDIGEIIGEDNCKCGLKGKYFLVHGRAKNSEIRGCSNI